MQRHHWIRLALICAFAVSTTAGQESKGQERFAGTWEAKLKGTTICTIELQAGETLTGSTRACRITVNQEGDLIEPEGMADSDAPSPILNARLEDDILSFEIKDEDDVMKFEMKVVGDGDAELSILNAPVRMKPIHFRRK